MPPGDITNTSAQSSIGGISSERKQERPGMLINIKPEIEALSKTQEGYST